MKTVRSLRLMLSSIRLAPHVLLFFVSDKKGLIGADIVRWTTIHRKGKSPTPINITSSLIVLMTFYPEFRNLFYFRLGFKGKIFSLLCPPMKTLLISSESIGPGLFIEHGFATVIAANKIGRNCWVNQQVTVGYSNATDCPSIGDNVTINAGAKVIGKVSIGDNARVGANAVVVKNVPANVTVVGVPAYIVKRDGKRVTEPL